VASIEKRTGENGKPEYRARWRDAAGKSRRSKWFARKHDADKLRATVEADLHRGSYVDMSNTTTVVEYAREWVKSRPLRKSSRCVYDTLIRVHLEPTPLGGRPLVKVRPSEIQSWVTGRARTIGPRTVRMHLKTLRSIFATAALDGVIASNPVQPARRLSLPEVPHNPVVPLTVEQVRSLAEATPDRYRAMVIVQAGLGLRQGELLALRVQDVNFLRRTVHIEDQLEKASLQRVAVKTPKSRRDIPMPTVVAEALARHMANYPPATDGLIFTEAASSRSLGGRTGQGVDHQRHVRLVREAAKRAGLPATATHDLRHHYACVLLHAGEGVHAVAERLGHTDATLVLKTYGHEMPNQEDRTRKAVDAAWSEAERERETGS
jgi:integrase